MNRLFKKLSDDVYLKLKSDTVFANFRVFFAT